jgi:hypothetical protein
MGQTTAKPSSGPVFVDAALFPAISHVYNLYWNYIIHYIVSKNNEINK